MADWLQPPKELPLPGAGTRVNNPDGSFSTERSMGVNIDGREYVLPTLLNGKQATPDEAIEAAKQRGLENYPNFATQEEASEFARNRSEALGAQGTAQEPQQREEEGKVAELLQQLIDATRATVEASDATTEAVREMATAMVEAMGAVKTAIENLNLGLE